MRLARSGRPGLFTHACEFFIDDIEKIRYSTTNTTIRIHHEILSLFRKCLAALAVSAELEFQNSNPRIPCHNKEDYEQEDISPKKLLETCRILE